MMNIVGPSECTARGLIMGVPWGLLCRMLNRLKSYLLRLKLTRRTMLLMVMPFVSVSCMEFVSTLSILLGRQFATVFLVRSDRILGCS